MRMMTNREFLDTLFEPGCSGELDDCGIKIKYGSSVLSAGGSRDGTYFGSKKEALEFFSDMRKDGDDRFMIDL